MPSDLLQVIHVGNRGSIYQASKLGGIDTDPTAHAVVISPASGASVPGCTAFTGDYQAPVYSFQNTEGEAGDLTEAVPYSPDVFDAGLSTSVQNRSSNAIGAGINVAAAAITRYYSVGLIAKTQNIGIDPAYQITGRPMEFGWDRRRKDVTIAKNAALREVKITCPAVTPPDVLGVTEWSQAVYVFETKPTTSVLLNAQGGVYVGEIGIAGGDVIDSFSTQDLAERGIMFPSTLVNARATYAVSKRGEQFVWADHGETLATSKGWVASDLSYPQVMSAYTDDMSPVPILDRLWLRKNGSTTEPAIDPIQAGTEILEWDKCYEGKRIFIGDSNIFALTSTRRQSTDTSDDEKWTVMELQSPLPAAITEPVDFRIAGQNFVFVGHTDPRLQDKVPAGVQLAVKDIGAESITGCIPDEHGADIFIFSPTKMVAMRNAQTSMSLFGEPGTGGTAPFLDTINSTLGCVAQNALVHGPGNYVCGFAAGRGPWIKDGATPRPLDENRNLGLFYDSLVDGQRLCCCAAYDPRLNIAMWAFPNYYDNGTGEARHVVNPAQGSRLLVYDFNVSILSFYEIAGVCIQALTYLQQYEEVTPLDKVGGKIIACTNEGNLIEFNDLVYGDLVTQQEDGFGMGGTITAIEPYGGDGALYTLDVSATGPISEFLTDTTSPVGDKRAVIIGRSPDFPRDPDFYTRLGSHHTGLCINGDQFRFSAGQWIGGAAQVGDVIAIMPQHLLFEGADLRSIRSYAAVDRIEALAMDMPETNYASWMWRTTVLSGKLGTKPTEAVETATGISSQALVVKQAHGLNRTKGGKAVRIRMDMFLPPDGANMTLNEVDYTARA